MWNGDWRAEFSTDELEAVDSFGSDDFAAWARHANEEVGPHLSLKQAWNSRDIAPIVKHPTLLRLWVRSCYLEYASIPHPGDGEDGWIDWRRLINAACRQLGEEAFIDLRRRRFLDETADSLTGVSADAATGSPGYVYVIKDVETGLIKIGRTESWLRRQKELGVDEAKILLMNLRWVRDSFEMEKTFHDRYRDYRLPQSEWFRLDHVPVI